MKFPSVIEYLTEAGLLDSDDEQAIEEAKKERRKIYLREKKKEYKMAHRSVTLSFPNKVMSKLETEAKKHRMRVPVYLRSCISSARNQTYLVPNADEVQEIELLLRRIGNHTNQIARLAHRMSLPPTNALIEIRGHIGNCEGILEQMFRQPKSLEQCVIKELKNNPGFAGKLLGILEDCTKQKEG